MAGENRQYLQRYVDGFKDALREGSHELEAHEHTDWDIKQYGAHFENKSSGIVAREGDEKGYDEGMKDAYATIGQDLNDHEFKEYSVEDYGKLYGNVAKTIGDCLNCKDIGSDKGCAAGMTIWCPRLLETLKE
jgi:hypothetical protein